MTGGHAGLGTSLKTQGGLSSEAGAVREDRMEPELSVLLEHLDVLDPSLESQMIPTSL